MCFDVHVKFSKHFDEDDYFLERQDSNPFRKKGPLKVRRLKPDAVPHIFSGKLDTYLFIHLTIIWFFR